MWLTLLGTLSLAAAPVADTSYQAGLDALKRKDAPAAVAGFKACLEADPARVDCAWELGWAYWIQGDWARVVQSWETVKRLSPNHPEVDENLQQARGQVELHALLAKQAREPVKPRPPLPPGAALTFRAVGDVMLGSDVPEGYLPPDDGAKMLEDVKPWLQDADVTFANLEGPLCAGGRTKKCGPKPTESCYAFRSPPHYGRYLLEAGVDLVSTANNHSGDFGEECRRETERTLDALGILWSGPPGSVAYLEKNGIKLAMIAFHTSLGTNYLNDTETAKALVKGAAARADIVVVSFHGGAEGAKYQHVPAGPEVFYGEERGNLREFTHAVIDAGADLVVGHGPHVLRAMEVYNDRLIAYSLGNFATYGRFNLKGPNGIGAVLEATMDGQGRFIEGRILPTRQIGDGIPVRDPKREAIDLVRALSREDFPESAVQIDEDGKLTAPGRGGAKRKAPGRP